MAFTPQELAFQPGIYSNRSNRASKQRWVDGNLVRFRNGMPAQVGGWQRSPVIGDAIQGRARAMLSWRPNDLSARLAAIGTSSNVYEFDGGAVSDITPDGLVAGRPDTIIGAGYGAGLYGKGSYGTPRTSSGNYLEAASWTFDLFGQVLIGCFSASGAIYEYTAGTNPKMIPVTNAPTARAICVSDERHVFAFGMNGQPNLVGWSDREDRTDWTPTTANRAGFYEMQSTSPFQCGVRSRGQILGFTQTEVFGFAPLSNALVYSKDRLSSECGVMGPHAVAALTDPSGDVAYWMGSTSFFMYDGLVRKLDCDLWDYVFKDLNLIQRAKVQAAVNSAFGEVWFFYPSASSNEINRAVIYSYETNTWSKADIVRLAWMDQGIFPLPVAVDDQGVIFQHELGDDADGLPIDSYVLSYPINVGVGQQLAQIADFWPDMDALSGETALTVVGRMSPGGDDILFGPYSFTPDLEKIDLNIEVRQFQLKIAGVSGPWELGLPLVSLQGGSLR